MKKSNVAILALVGAGLYFLLKNQAQAKVPAGSVTVGPLLDASTPVSLYPIGGASMVVTYGDLASQPQPGDNFVYGGANYTLSTDSNNALYAVQMTF